MDSFKPVWHHRLKYMLTPQFDLYRNIAEIFAGDSVLDYGCGTGFGLLPFAPLYPSRTLVGVDKDLGAVAFANDVLGKIAWFHNADWSSGHVTIDQKFDLITCIEVIEHVEKPEALIKALVSALAPGGKLVVSTLNHKSQYRKNDDHVSRFTVKMFSAMVKKFCPDFKLSDYKLKKNIELDSTVTPIVAIWSKPFVDGQMGSEVQTCAETS
jgi:2-polyprenyl-3-methyl-5-hydroxy-6-metoxy-1,4-benzoquinol methylase